MAIMIDGPAGGLEALYSTSGQAVRGALLCHPHPSYGGSMHDGVLGIVAQILESDRANISQSSPQDGSRIEPYAHLRFNFRGVGGSAGTFDNGRGEQADLVAAWNWLVAQNDWEELTLVGYSFGAAIAWEARNRCAGLKRLVLIAPPTASMPLNAEENGEENAEENGEENGEQIDSTHIIVGRNDTYCDLANLPSSANTKIIDGGDHFFSNTAGQLADTLTEILYSG